MLRPGVYKGQQHVRRRAHTGGHQLPTTRQCPRQTHAARFLSMRRQCKLRLAVADVLDGLIP